MATVSTGGTNRVSLGLLLDFGDVNVLAALLLTPLALGSFIYSRAGSSFLALRKCHHCAR